MTASSLTDLREEQLEMYFDQLNGARVSPYLKAALSNLVL